MHEATTPSGTPSAVRGAYGIVALLTAINLINYIDRYVLAAVGTQITEDLRLNHEQLGWLASVLIFSYMLFTPLFGWWGDRYSRTKLMAAGVAIWSIATALGGLATDFVHMLAARAFIGIGEASYASVTPSLIADYFPPERRATPIGVFNAAIPVGAALGFVLGGWLGVHFGWRSAFFMVGLPGLAMAAAAYMIREPQRGATDSAADRAQTAERGRMPWWQSYFALLRSRLYVLSVLGYTAVTFAVGALGFWGVIFFQTDKGLSEGDATALFGIMTATAGMAGTFLGGLFRDWLLRRTRRAYTIVCALSAALTVVPMIVAISSTDRAVYLPATFLAVFFAFLGNGPVNAIIVNSVAADLRVSAVALSILSIHVLGDVISQPLVGAISDYLKDTGGAVPGVFQLIAGLSGLDPATHYLSLALLVLPLAMIAGSLFFLAAMRAQDGE